MSFSKRLIDKGRDVVDLLRRSKSIQDKINAIDKDLVSLYTDVYGSDYKEYTGWYYNSIEGRVDVINNECRNRVVTHKSLIREFNEVAKSNEKINIEDIYE